MYVCILCWVGVILRSAVPWGKGGGPGPKGHCSSGEMLEALWQGVGAEH